MRRSGSVLLLFIIAALLAGCVYDPYTGTYYPCCSYYGYPYQYPYPPYYQYPPGYTYQPALQPPPPPGRP